jgi:NAD(P)-dependent dehydrogenase (short-subunit alcohol dehydrogenase family)
VAVRFDLRAPGSIGAAPRQAADATLLINNASTASFAAPLEADLDAVHDEIAVNFEGLYRTIRALVPVLESAGGGQVVNILSLLSLASTSPMTGYSASKAAAHSLTQALRPVLASKGITVHGVYPGGIDTGIDTPKTPPADVAAGILAGLVQDEEDIFPDAYSEAMSRVWWSDPKSFEQAFALPT